MGFFAKAVMWLIAKTIRDEAVDTSYGLEGSIGKILLVFPIIVSILFGWIGGLAVRDPDPDDRVTGCILLSLAALLVVYLLHLASYRVIASEDVLCSRSWIVKERKIDFSRPFDLGWTDDDTWFLARQDSVSIKISSFVHGHTQIFDLVHRKNRRF